MKKNVLLFALLTFVSASGLAQKPWNEFVVKYKKSVHADYVHIGRFWMIWVRPFMQGIHSLEALDFTVTSVQQEVRNEMKQLQWDLIKDGYAELMFVKSDGEKVHMLGKIKNDNIVKDCVLLLDSYNEISIVRITGKINLDGIGKISGTFGKTKFNVAKK
jgi:hypothetical protein